MPAGLAGRDTPLRRAHHAALRAVGAICAPALSSSNTLKSGRLRRSVVLSIAETSRIEEVAHLRLRERADPLIKGNPRQVVGGCLPLHQTAAVRFGEGEQ